MSSFPQTALCVLGLIGWFFLIRQSIDDWFATPLVEEGEVTGRRYFPPHPGSGRFSPKPETWMLRVANAGGEGWVQVTEQEYEEVRQGDRFWVSGKRGRITKRWYLTDARKITDSDSSSAVVTVGR